MDHARNLLDRLQGAARLSFTASSNNAEGWNGEGEGVVTVDATTPHQIVFHESGQWRSPRGREFRFRNVFRWSRIGDDLVRLEHLRMGVDKPILLFDLAPDGESRWASVGGHQCKSDCYTAALSVGSGEIHLEWAIDGPGRRDVIGYVYRGAA